MSRAKYIAAALCLVLAACTSQKEPQPSDKVLLGVTMGDGSVLSTKAGPSPVYVPMNTGADVYLRVEGNWPAKSEYPIVKYAHGVASAPSGYKNQLTLTPELTWADFGVPVFDNPVGQADGLTIYAAAIAEGTTPAPEVVEQDWHTFEWVLATGGPDILKGDLLYSDNYSQSKEGTYKYAMHETPALLKMNHAMSLLTVYVTAGEGFPTTGIGATPHKFEAAPTLVFTPNRYGQHMPEYCYTKGRVNIPAGVVTPDDGSQRPITAKVVDDNTPDATLIYQALCFPGSHLHRPSDTDIHMKIVLPDGTHYYVPALKMNHKMMEVTDTPVTLQGHNYIWHLTINKTSIVVEVTVEKWHNVTAEEETIIVH